MRSVDAPDTTGDIHQWRNQGRAAQEPGEGGTTAATEPEATGKFGPAGFGEQVGGGIVDGDVRGLDVGAIAGRALDRQAHREDRHQTDRG